MADAVESADVLVGLPAPLTFPATASDIIISVRDQIPDQIYDSAGNPDPDSDIDQSPNNQGNTAFIPVRTLYRFLTNGLRTMSQLCNWFVEDWIAFPSQNYQATYTLDAKWHGITAAFANRFRCTFLDEAHVIYSSYAVAQPLWYGWHARKGPLDLFYYPAPNVDDPVMTLATAMTTTSDSAVMTATLPSTFLSFGWLRIDGEMMQYQRISGATASVLRRGASGTHAAEHAAGSDVQHCSLWAKGVRTPRPVFQSIDAIEVPLAFIAPLEMYVLAGAKRVEQELGQAKELMAEFNAACLDIRSDPAWQAPDGTYQVRLYGEPAYGLYFGRVIVP